VKFLWRRRMKLKTEELMVEKENDEVKDWLLYGGAGGWSLRLWSSYGVEDGWC
jgi:hypothetical protein